jgi:hypothetical protein
MPGAPTRAFAAAATLTVAAWSVEGAAIVDLTPVVRSGGIFVSFRATDAFDEEIERAIATGLEVAFRYNVELKRARGVWFDAVVAGREIRATVTYDNLTKRYKLTRELGGKIDSTEVVADAEAMRRFMTSCDSLRLFELSELEPNERYYVRVKGVLKERTLLLFVPWDFETGWTEAHFSYVP